MIIRLVISLFFSFLLLGCDTLDTRVKGTSSFECTKDNVIVYNHPIPNKTIFKKLEQCKDSADYITFPQEKISERLKNQQKCKIVTICEIWIVKSYWANTKDSIEFLRSTDWMTYEKEIK